MPTIQLKLDDADYQELLDMTGENTGSKAIHFLIRQYQVEREFHHDYKNKYSELHQIHSKLKNNSRALLDSFTNLAQSLENPNS